MDSIEVRPDLYRFLASVQASLQGAIDPDRAVADFTEASRLKPESGRSYFARALANRRKRDLPAALADVSAAVERNPKSDSALNLRASIHYRLGDYRAALADHLAAHELDPDDAGTLNHLAWLRATCTLDEVRDGEAALRDATRACELTDYAAPGYLDTLAAAYAELGNFEDAVRWQEKAIKLVVADQRPEYETRLELYKAGKPYRDEAEKPATGTGESGA